MVVMGKQYDTDCSGFVRLLYNTVTGLDLPAWTLSDRRFARAKDWVNFFKTLPSVEDEAQNNSKDSGQYSELKDASPRFKNLCWRRVTSISNVMKGDIIAYTISGRAAGSSCFIKPKSLSAVLHQVAMSQLYDENKGDYSVLEDVDRLHSRAQEMKMKIMKSLQAINIATLRDLRDRLYDDCMGKAIDINLESNGLQPQGKEFWSRAREACLSTVQHTGHIVIASSLPFRLGKDDKGRTSYTVPTYESTNIRNQKEDNANGVMEWYRSFSQVPMNCKAKKVKSPKGRSPTCGERSRIRTKKSPAHKRLNQSFIAGVNGDKRRRWTHPPTEKRAFKEYSRAESCCVLEIGRLLGDKIQNLKEAS
mmetsp:Transcript_25361/g.61082  ORF Transcript_25361/g.61082 Transcript_25361/m.61082 type:complete len:363 (+) Transcript_25361:73-1161(+)